jgi:hypothetical protein
MAIEEEIALRHYETGERIVVEAIRTSKKGEYIAHCINPNHPDKHASMGINIIKGVYNCISRHDASGITWEKHLESKGSPGEVKKAIKKREYDELKNKLLMGITTDLVNWAGYDSEAKKDAKIRLPFDLCSLPKQEKDKSVRSLIEAGIFRKSELSDLIKKVEEFTGETEEKREKKEKKAITKTLIPGLIHLIKEGEKVSYLLQHENKLYIEDTYSGESEVIYQPKQDLPIYHIERDILKESREIDPKDLLKKIISFIKDYLELSEKEGYLILALWTLHTYLIEQFDVTPIIYFYGLKETGKTRAGEVLEQLAFKCERLTSPTEATLFRSAEYFKTTLIIDEVKLWGKNGNEEVERLIKSRYKRGLKVSRCNTNKSGEDMIEYFDVFAPLVLSTTYDIPLIIQDRSIRFLMQKNANASVEGAINKELARKLRNKLTIFRANHFSKKLKETGDVSRRRLNEIMKPLYQILKEVDPDREKEFKLIVKDLETDRKSEERFTSTASVVEEIVKFYNETSKNFISTRELTIRLNEDRSDDEKTNTTRVGRQVKPLGFKKIEREHKLGYIINIEKLHHLIERFNISGIEPKEQSLFSS